ncbi:MAG: VanZ family protein [Bacilli bacterium]|nr:VanZ family protein [Bacilli bacterium]
MIKKKADLIQLIVWAVIALGTLIFIFSNSFKDGPESMKQSSVIVEVVESVVDPGHKMEEGLLHTIVRKSAHFTEFFVLGLSLRMMFIFVSRLTKKNFYILPFFICLLSAVTDEFIQSFTGRTSAILDVLIDFSGSALAILLVMMGMLIVHLIKSKKIEIEQKEEDASN